MFKHKLSGLYKDTNQSQHNGFCAKDTEKLVLYTVTGSGCVKRDDSKLLPVLSSDFYNSCNEYRNLSRKHFHSCRVYICCRNYYIRV